MSNIKDMFKDLLNEIQKQAFDKAECKVQIEINGRRVEGNVDGNSTGLLIIISSLIDTACKRKGMEREEYLRVLKGMWSITNTIECDSHEQADVIEQIIKNRDQDGEKK